MFHRSYCLKIVQKRRSKNKKVQESGRIKINDEEKRKGRKKKEERRKKKEEEEGKEEKESRTE
jgi:hypothetical protein